MIICLVRHGQTEWNTRSLIQGQTDNVLNEVGKKQAETVGDYLKKFDPYWDEIISSPLKRAYQTAEIIKERLNFNKDIVKDKNVMERNFGILEGEVLNSRTYDIIAEEKVEGLESIKDLQNRSTNALLEIAKKYPNKKVLVFSHAQFIKSVITYLDPTFNFRSLLKNSSLNYFDVKEGKINIIKYNITPED